MNNILHMNLPLIQTDYVIRTKQQQSIKIVVWYTHHLRTKGIKHEKNKKKDRDRDRARAREKEREKDQQLSTQTQPEQ
jgi:hypothetical protein